MRVKLILPALTEATSPFFRPVKYSLFPPLGQMTLAAYLDDSDDVTIADEHVRPLRLDDEPELVAIEAYVTSARRAYEIADHYRARGAHVCIGGLHATSLPEEAALHADTVFLGPGEDTWPAFLADFRAGHPRARYLSTVRTLVGAPRPRRDLVDRRLYLAPNSLVVSRGCPHACDFCYKEPFFAGGRSFYTRRVDEALTDVASLPGRHVFFLDDHLFADRRFAIDLFGGMRGMHRVWQGAGTVASILDDELLDAAVASGLRSLFVGFETLGTASLREQGKLHNIGADYAEAVRRLHDRGVMVNASFVFGMDGDDADVFGRTVEWALENAIETSTFHVLTPYPGTALHGRLAEAGRITTTDWDRYDTRRAVFVPARMSAEELEDGYRRAYRDFYAWGSIFRGVAAGEGFARQLRHLAYTAGWKKCEPVWDAVIRARRVGTMLPALETVLDATVTEDPGSAETATPTARGQRRWADSPGF
jgi:radical SAM superfamily enzyme YgiQ (UPF0313 family)